MAKHAKKSKKKRKVKTVNQFFKGDLSSVRKAIKAAEKVVERGRKQAAVQVEKGTSAPVGSPASKNLVFNKDALRRAEQLLLAFGSAKGLMAAVCCHNDENCNFMVRSTRVTRAS